VAVVAIIVPLNVSIRTLKLYNSDIDNTTQHYFFRELNSTIFHRFLVAYYDCVISFFPARQVSEKIFNESSKSTENVLTE
jgi:hypothetical protein